HGWARLYSLWSVLASSGLSGLVPRLGRGDGTSNTHPERDRRQPGVSDEIGMEQMPELPHPVGEPRCRPRVIPIAVDRHRPAWPIDPLGARSRMTGAESARPDDDELRLEREHRLPARRVRRLA